MTMRRASELLGSMRALAHIRPPCALAAAGKGNHDGPCKGSYADWHRFLEQCRDAGVAAILAPQDGKDDGKFHGFATALGLALLRRWRWLRDCEALGVPFDQAEQLFQVSMERDKDAITKAEQERVAALARAQEELEADDVLRHAGELGL